MTSRRSWRVFSRLVGFGAIPALSLASSVVLLPLIAHRFGPGGWSAVSVGSAVGAYVGVVVGLSWPIVGAHAVARGSDAERRAIYATSVRNRASVFVIVIVPAALVTLMLTARTGNGLPALLVTIAIGLNGFTASWFFAGASRPWLLVRNEALTRCASYAVIIAALALGAPFWTYGAVLTAAGFAMVVFNHRTILGTVSALRLRSESGPARIRDHVNGAVARLSNSAFLTLTPVLFAAIAVPGLHVFTAFDQVQKAAGNALGVVPQAFVSFVSSPASSEVRRRRIRLVIVGVSSLALLVFLSSLALGRVVITVLYGDRVQPELIQIALVGAVTSLQLIGQFLQQVVLVPLGQAAKTYLVMSCVSIAAIPVFLGAAFLAGVTGALATVACASLAVAASYAVLVVIGLRRAATHRGDDRIA